MHFHIRVQHWVVDWFVIGVICGIAAVVNILVRAPSPDELRFILLFGALFWIIGGIICYGFEGIKIESPHRDSRKVTASVTTEQHEYHCASDFLFPGNGRGLFSRRH